jgi:fumarate reductase subunit D
MSTQTISPIYVLSILLSVPVGLIMGFRFADGNMVSVIATAITPALIIAVIAFIHTRQKNRIK